MRESTQALRLTRCRAIHAGPGISDSRGCQRLRRLRQVMQHLMAPGGSRGLAATPVRAGCRQSAGPAPLTCTLPADPGRHRRARTRDTCRAHRDHPASSDGSRLVTAALKRRPRYRRLFAVESKATAGRHVCSDAPVLLASREATQEVCCASRRSRDGFLNHVEPARAPCTGPGRRATPAQ